jgi:hypothetical protein
LGYNEYGAYGQRKNVKIPELDTLAESSIKFINISAGNIIKK